MNWTVYLYQLPTDPAIQPFDTHDFSTYADALTFANSQVEGDLWKIEIVNSKKLQDAIVALQTP